MGVKLRQRVAGQSQSKANSRPRFIGQQDFLATRKVTYGLFTTAAKHRILRRRLSAEQQVPCKSRGYLTHEVIAY